MQTQSASQKIQGWAFRNPAMILFCRYRVRNQYLRVRTAALHHRLWVGGTCCMPILSHCGNTVHKLQIDRSCYKETKDSTQHYVSARICPVSSPL